MRDFVFTSMKIEKNTTGCYPLFGWAVEEYAATLAANDYPVPDNMTVAGVIFEPTDSKESVVAACQILAMSNTDILVFDFLQKDGTHKFNPDTITWIEEGFQTSEEKYKELPNVYEARIVYALNPAKNHHQCGCDGNCGCKSKSEEVSE